MRTVQPLTLDDLDKKILGYLQQDGRMTFVTLAAHLGVSEGTIRKRVKRLEDAGVLKTMGVTDPLKMGLDTVAFIWFKVDRLHLETVIAALTQLSEVRYLVVTTGGYDLVAMVVLPNRTQLVQLLNDKLSQIEGIISTETSIVLQIHKQIHEWAPFKEYVDKEVSHG
ncbi:MAG: Lrp/AsnC family transcriptional regulator [Limnochordia bacterium]|nr:Lrp/AsnC family transcriptional regulator [Limnochordia bacterium]MDI9464865.1 Lrp/AsnC family transcriptional regulator [Bacillota bacterium]NLO96114.1 Lrp/AsnC family transcriptional regulator [Bacillota bacterium]HAN94946.1 Lrp/AsnC family transcriptional regulator [Bacillota bacterium]HOB39771.1 Lrp/AsnC family transcriptional regulator [Limnochordia bacterium]